MSTTACGLEACGLTRTFGPRTALEAVDLRVARGSLVALMGSNGAGKTTLMKILATLLLPTHGSARVLGQDVVGQAMACRRLIGFVPAEERSFYGRLTVVQNLECFSALHGVTGAQFKARSAPLLERLGLERHVRTRFGDLSSGLKQSLSLVRALLHEPPVLLLDEPTRSLSPDLAQGVADLLRGLVRTEGRTILLATHNLGEAEAVADEVALLHRGRLLVQGAPPELCREHGLSDLPAAQAVFRHFTREAPGEERP